ncbi:Fe(3+) dicitrate transport protein [Lewinella marina]|uniref:TonB-dependent receptor n=1 Tax=Neolewinella marina TaxID=438751 RepID=A0A2G0CIU9_9BACT|nr:TonB-dependent receptor [Neolewinella marina]NJB84936.1 Fe(3+) dicitrate transport protein [Neolewinella marina]PHK99911.1 TonB-dependent receptor [Neolewinella marina]
MDSDRLLFLVCLLLGWSCLFGQRTVGLVVTDTSGTAIPDTEIFVAETARLFTTDAGGRAAVALPATGPATLTVFAIGFATRQVAVTGEEASLRLELQPLSLNLSSVTIVAEARRREALTRLRAVEGTAIYAGRKTEVVSLDALTVNLATNQARQIYGEVSGLNIYENDDAGLQLNIGGRGLDPSRSASFNTRQNGYDISADVLGYPESYYTPPAEALARIEVVRGAASLQYGTQFGGLVNFVFREPERTRQFVVNSRQTVGSNGLFTSFNSLSGQTGPVGYYGFYNYKRGDGFRPNSGFQSHNAFLHLDFAPAFLPNTRIAAEYTYLDYLAQQPGGLTDAQFYRDPFSSNRERNWFAVDWQLYNLKVEHRFSVRTNFSLNVFGLDAGRRAVGFRTNRVSQTEDLTAPRDLLIGRFRNYGAEARILHRYRIGQQEAIALLGTKVYRANNAAIQGPGTAEGDADFSLATDRFPSYPNQSDFTFPNRNVAVFGEHIFYLTDRFSVTPGARFEYIRTESRGSYRRFDFDLAGNPIREETFTDDRVFERNLLLLGVGLSYRHSEGLEAFANVSENYRSVTFNDIRTVNPSFQIDPNIRDESGYTLDAGLRGRKGRWSYTANTFAIRYGNRLGEVLTPEVRTNADGQEVETGRIVRRRGNIGAAFLYGLESLVEWRLLDPATAADGSQPYALTLFANTSLTDSRYTDSEIAGVAGNRVEFIPRLNLKTGLRFGYGNLLGSLQYSYLSRQYTDASNAEQDRADNQSGIVGSIPAYGVADLSLSYRWRFLTLESGINNLMNESYFTRRATGYPGPGIIPSAPRTFYLTLALQLPGGAR